MASYKNSSSMDAEAGAAYVSSAAHRRNDAAAYLDYPGAHTAMTLIDGGAADLFLGARTAALTENGAPYIFSGVPTAAQTQDNVADLYPSVHADAASKVTNGAPVIFPDVRVPGFAAGRSEMLPFPTQTMAAAYYNSGVVAGEALPLASQVFGGKTTSVPAVAVAQDKVAGAFTARLRHELPVPGLSVASLAVTGLTAGEPTPAVGFGLFLMLIVGLSTFTARAFRD